MLPARGIFCPVQIAELQAGVLVAVDVHDRRLVTLGSTVDTEILAIDVAVEAEGARLRVYWRGAAGAST